THNYTLSLHDALPISIHGSGPKSSRLPRMGKRTGPGGQFLVRRLARIVNTIKPTTTIVNHICKHDAIVSYWSKRRYSVGYSKIRSEEHTSELQSRGHL